MKPNIVVLDGYTLAPSDPDSGHSSPTSSPTPPLDWGLIEALGPTTVYDRSTEQQAAHRAADAPIVLTNKTPLSAPTIASLPQLRYIGVLATGVNVVDLDAARQHQVVVTNIPGYGTDSVAQHVFALMLELVGHIGAHNQAVHAGQWTRCADFSFTVAPITELAGKTMGIVGLGAIGRRVAQIAHALGMRVAAAHQSSMSRVRLPGIEIQWLPLDDLVAAADVITLHCPLTPQTHHLVNARLLARVKPTAILINTGRGPLIDEQALADALTQHRIAGAGLDVLSHEPPPPDNPLLTAPRCVITPHIAWASVEARQRLMGLAAKNIQAFLSGKPINVVNA